MKYNFHIYLLGNLMFGFCQWVTIILLVKYSNITLLGHYTYGIAIVAPLILLLSFGLNTLIVTNNKFKKNIYFKMRCITSMITLYIYMLIVIIWSDISSEVYALMFFIAVTRVAENINDIQFAYWISGNKHKKVGIFKIFLSIFQIMLISCFIIIYNTLLPALVIYSMSLLIYILIRNKKQLKISINDIKKIVILSSIGIPISLTLFLSSLNSNIPKYLLEFYSNIESVGIFSSLLTIYSVGSTFIFSIYNFLLPRVVNNKENYIFLKKLLINILIFFSFILLITIPFSLFYSKDILNIIFSEGFQKYGREFTLLTVSACLIYVSILLDLFINSHKMYKYNTLIQLISVLVILITSIVIIPELNVFGAMISFGIYGCIVFILKLVLTLKIIKRVKNIV